MHPVCPIYPPPQRYRWLQDRFDPVARPAQWIDPLPCGGRSFQELLAQLPEWNLSLALDRSIRPQGYAWRASGDGILLRAADRAGFRHGLHALQQWTKGALVPGPGCLVEDYPAFAWRGFMLDVSRCRVPTRSTLEQLVRSMAALRMNELQLYTEHTFAYRNHATVWEQASPLTGDDIRWLDRLCQEHGIRLVPNQNCFGHMERWLIHPAYRCLAECPGPFTNRYGTRYPVGPSLRPDGHSLDFVTGLLDELLPCFREKTVNVGCDETFDLGQGRTAPEVRKQGLKTVYLRYLNALARRLADRGYRAQCWADILIESGATGGDLADNLVPMVWGYEPDHPFREQLERVANGSRPFYVVPGTSGWNSLSGRLDTGLANLRAAAEAGRQAGATGCLITEWGDQGHHQPEPVTLFGLTLGAAEAWQPGSASFAGAEAWLDSHVFTDPTGRSAAWWRRAGTCHRLLDHPLRNTSPAARALLDQPERARVVLSAIPAQRWRTFDQALADLQAEVAAQTPSPGQNKTPFKAQAEAAIALGRLAALRAAIHHGETPPDAWSERRIDAVDRHRAAWLMTARPGGLEESCSRIPIHP